MYCTMNNAGSDGAIFWISFAYVILQRWKVVRCVQFYWTRGYFSKTERCLQKMLCLTLEYIKSCWSGLSLNALGCSAGQILVQKFTKVWPPMRDSSYEVTYSFRLCVCTRCLSICAPSFVAQVWCKWALRVITCWAWNMPQTASITLSH